MKAILRSGTLLLSMLTATVASGQTLHPAPKHPVHAIHYTPVSRHEIARREAAGKHERYVRSGHRTAYNGHAGTLKRHDGYIRDIY